MQTRDIAGVLIEDDAVAPRCKDKQALKEADAHRAREAQALGEGGWDEKVKAFRCGDVNMPLSVQMERG